MSYFSEATTNQIIKVFSAWAYSIRSLLIEPYKWILNSSIWRLRWFGVFHLICHPLFYWVWSSFEPQPYESFSIRVIMTLLGFIYIVFASKILNGNIYWKYLYTFLVFIHLPFFFLFMGYMNDFNSTWLGTSICMILLYYQFCDWRLATYCSFATIIILCLIHFIRFDNFSYFINNKSFNQFVLVYGFAWTAAIVMGASTANLVKQNLLNISFNLGVMAHELRTPISSINIINHILKNRSIHTEDPVLSNLSDKITVMLKTINQHIDRQIANAKLNHSDSIKVPCNSFELTKLAIANYPFKTSVEQSAVQLSCEQNFSFLGNDILFSQVLNNLLKNAFRAMYTKELDEKDMRLTIYIGTKVMKDKLFGYISISDNGVGIKSIDLNRVLEPFVSSAGPLGHGLGLAFCKNVLESWKGKISIVSTYGTGTTIRIELPILPA